MNHRNKSLTDYSTSDLHAEIYEATRERVSAR